MLFGGEPTSIWGTVVMGLDQHHYLLWTIWVTMLLLACLITVRGTANAILARYARKSAAGAGYARVPLGENGAATHTEVATSLGEVELPALGAMQGAV